MSGAATAGLIDVDWLVQRIPGGAQPMTVADLVASAITSGQLRRGTRLPTMRELSAATGLGFRTISEAWTLLRDRGLIETRRRGGSFVAAFNTDSAVPPFAPTPLGAGRRLDLGKSAADPTLLPDLAHAFEFGLQAPNLHSSVREFITSRLYDCARRSWPFAAEGFIASGSGAEAALLSILGVTPAGTTVAVDEPANPGFLGSLRGAGLQVVGVTADAEGPKVQSLSAAIAAGATTYAFQASAPYSRGVTITEARLAALADVLGSVTEPVTVVEEDAVGPLTTKAPASFGPRLAGRVVHVRSFCKSYGVDLRTSLIGGSQNALQSIQSRRSTGLAVTSRILQDALAYLMECPDTAAVMTAAKQRYAQRRTACIDALAEHGIDGKSGPDGQFVWIDVPDELDTILRLASEGITVGAGSECYTQPSAGSIRLATMRLPDDPDVVDDLALTVARTLQGLGVNYYV
ncbi:aminotransferase class I/II-fold pyridoxal phosphate-dependent enzyme [Mycolicibacterium tusciae]|uniref:aminotransferase class I/II-fold pyridoxal phosphate-dependent enzyme n=1 Tax=Mycolicibacterium tusciae TaxID=75922 RepID=UPI001EF98B54|nr:aminotransferase class I/II-fold pyridoxal phosphate-dependent enzyme [Mycolicibacterium tusciae]